MGLGGGRSRRRTRDTRRAGERHGKAGGSGDSGTRGVARMDPRSRATQVGDGRNEPRQCAFQAGRTRRLERRGWKKPSIAYRATLQEWTRERAPMQWAMVQGNLGAALDCPRQPGERNGAFRGGGGRTPRRSAGTTARGCAAAMGNARRQSRRRAGSARRAGERTARLEEAVAAYRAELQETTREKVPPQWAMAENNLGVGLLTLGERESGAATGGGGNGLSRRVTGADPRAGATRMGRNPAQPGRGVAGAR